MNCQTEMEDQQLTALEKTNRQLKTINKKTSIHTGRLSSPPAISFSNSGVLINGITTKPVYWETQWGVSGLSSLQMETCSVWVGSQGLFWGRECAGLFPMKIWKLHSMWKYRVSIWIHKCLPPTYFSMRESNPALHFLTVYPAGSSYGYAYFEDQR